MHQDNKSDAYKYQLASINGTEETEIVDDHGQPLMLDDAGRIQVNQWASDLGLTPEEGALIESMMGPPPPAPPAPAPKKVMTGKNVQISVGGVKLPILMGHFHVSIDSHEFWQKEEPKKQTEETLFRDVKRFRKALSKRKFNCERALLKWQELRHNVDVLRDVYADNPSKWEARSADLEKQVLLIKKKLGYMANSSKSGKKCR